jgi:peroxiredoxin
MVGIGRRAPDFTLLSDEGKAVTLSKELGHGLIVLSFWVFDSTSVCLGQLSAMPLSPALAFEGTYVRRRRSHRHR